MACWECPAGPEFWTQASDESILPFHGTVASLECCQHRDSETLVEQVSFFILNGDLIHQSMKLGKKIP